MEEIEVIEIEHHPCGKTLVLVGVEEGSYEYYRVLLHHIIDDCPGASTEMRANALLDSVRLEATKEEVS